MCAVPAEFAPRDETPSQKIAATKNTVMKYKNFVTELKDAYSLTFQDECESERHGQGSWSKEKLSRRKNTRSSRRDMLAQAAKDANVERRRYSQSSYAR